MAQTHEVYPNAPLALVAMEVRFSNGSTSTGIQMQTQRAFRDLLGKEWVIEQQQAHRLSISIGPITPGAPTPIQTVSVPRFTIRDRTMAVVLTESSLTVETTAYKHYEDFRTVIQATLTAASEIMALEGVSRVGLRYIDEIRVPGYGLNGPIWSEWLDPSLIPPYFSEMAKRSYPPFGWDGTAQYKISNDQALVLRYGPRIGHVVNPTGPLKRLNVAPPGPMFMLDFDGFWEPQGIPEFNAQQLVETCDELKIPIRELFDLVITDRLVNEFRKEVMHGCTLNTDQMRTSTVANETPPISRTLTIDELTEDIGHDRNVTRQFESQIAETSRQQGELHHQAFAGQLTGHSREIAKQGPQKILRNLAERGFAWRDIARLIAVSVPALRRWRQGEQPTGTNLLKMAKLLAFVEILHNDHLVTSVASWLEIPLVEGFPITGMDLAADEKYEDLLDLAANHVSSAEIILDKWQPDWRSRYASDFEIFVAPDGLPGIRSMRE